MEIVKIIVSMIIVVLCINCYPAQAKEIFKVQRTSKGQYFIINDNQFTARSICSQVFAGDSVRFVEGGPSGVCITATFIDLRTGAPCDV